MKPVIHKQLERLNRQETALLKKGDSIFSRMAEVIGQRIPNDRKDKLEKAFYQGFLTALSKSKGSYLRNMIHLGVSTVGGMVLGVLGRDMPDIPVFIAALLNGIYEIADEYGYSCEQEEELYYVFLLIEASLAEGSKRSALNNRVNEITEYLSHGISVPCLLDEQIRRSAEALAWDMQCAKFVQGFPVIGAVGGISNAVYLNKVMKYVRIMFHKRFLLSK